MVKKTSEHELEEIKKNFPEIEDKYRLLYENYGDPVFLMVNGKFIDCNKAALEILHCQDKDQILGLCPSQISPEKQHDGRFSEEKEKKAIYFDDNKKRDQFEWVHRTFDGTDFWVQVSLTVVHVHGRPITLVHWRDITERKKIEYVLRKSELDYRNIYDNAMVGIYQSTPEGRYLRVNPALASIHGFSSPDEMVCTVTNIGEQLYVNPEDRKRYMKLLEKDDMIRDFEAQLYRKDKSRVWISMNVRVVRRRDGSIAYYEGIVEDITLRKKAEAEIKESEERYRSLFYNSMDAILLTAPDGRTLAANPEACKIFGCTEEELRRVGREGVLDSTDPRLVEAFKERKSTGRFRGELTFLRKNGAPFPGEISSIIFKDRDGKENTSMVIRDITERKHAEERLRTLLCELENRNKKLLKAYEDLKMSESMLIQSEKMASLGQLSAGIAHELKNPLSIILQGIAYVQSSVEDGTLIDACDRIKKSAIRADIVIQNLLSFSRQAPPSFSEEDINALIEEALNMVEHQMNLQNIEIIRNYFLHIPKIRVDSNQIREVFINIFINAAEAMKDGGTITLTTKAGIDKDGEPCVRAVIEDTGTGIPDEILKNILDPFFTTKTDSGGTGLGLSVTKGIVDRHHGGIAISSKEGEGTTVTITLPCNPFEKEGHHNG